MGIQLFFHNHIEVLAKKIAGDLAAEMRGSDPFSQPLVMVANPNVGKWLQLEVARHNTVAANIEYPFLEKGLWNIISWFDGSDPKPALLKPDDYQFLILSAILSGRSPDQRLKFLLRYLYDASGSLSVDHSRRAWQLSDKLASVLREYEYNREAMIGAWLEDRPFYRQGEGASEDVQRVEEAERSLYRALFIEGGIRDQLCRKTGKLLLTLPQYERRIFSAGAERPRLRENKGRVVHIFGTSQISSFHMRLLFEIGRHLDVKFYLLNVCREFWEDIDTPQEERFKRIRQIHTMQLKDGESLAVAPSDNKILSLWGKPGRENLRLLGDLEEASQGKISFLSDWLSESPGKDRSKKRTVLETIQDHILNRVPSDGKAAKMEQDASVQIAGCPGIYREVETVYNSIIANMRGNKDLKLTDIAVLVPNMPLYRNAIESVFSRAPQHVPYNLTDSTAAEESVFAGALVGMLDLASGSFTRKEVFDLIFNSAFLAGSRLTRQDALIWARWADELNIFRNFDKEDKARRGYAATDLYTWQQGLRRLRLGRIMDAADTNDELARAFPAYRDTVPFADIDSQDTALVSDFCRIVETLMRRISDMRDAKLSCSEWSEKIIALMDDFLDMPSDRPEEESVIKSVRAAMVEFAENDILFGLTKTGSVDLALVREYLSAKLGDIKTGRGRYLAGGVTVSTLLPLRPIPFEIVYILGLGEGEFPGYPDYSILDLRHQRRLLGDVSKPEANRYLFLETLVSTRSKLYLTYVSRDLQKDKEFHPCSAVNEIRDYLDENVLDEPFKTLKDAFPAWLDDVPLKGSSAKYLEDLEGVKSWSDILVNFSVPDRLLCLLDIKQSLAGPRAKKLEVALSEKRDQLVVDSSAVSRSAKALPAEDVSLRELGRFLANPIDAVVRRHLELYEDRQPLEAIIAEDEPFYSGYVSGSEFGSDMLKRFVAAWADKAGRPNILPADLMRSHFEQYYRYCKLQGKTPEDAFGELDRKTYERKLIERLGSAGGIISFLRERERCEFCATISMGDPYASVASDIALPALGIGKAVLSGGLRFVWKNSAAKAYDILVITEARKQSVSGLSRQHFMPLLFYMAAGALRSSGSGAVKKFKWFEGMPIRIFCACSDGISEPLEFYMAEKDAGRYLEKIVADLARPGDFDLIPFDIISKGQFLKEYRPDEMKASASASEKEEYRQQLEEAIAWEMESAYSSYRPSDIALLCNAQVPEDVYDKVQRRFGPFYGGIISADRTAQKRVTKRK